MNNIPLVRSIPKGLTDVEISSIFYLLSKTLRSGEDIISAVSETSLRRQYALDEDELEELLDSLYDKGLIEEEDDGSIIVGYYSGDTPILYISGVEETPEGLFNGLLEMAQSFKKLAKRPHSRHLSTNCLERVKDLSSIKPIEYKVGNLLTLYKTCLEIYLQEETRNFDKVEAGMMKNLLKSMGGIKTVQIIIAYCLGYEVWGKYPAVGIMLKNKDGIYASIKADVSDMGEEKF